MNTDKREFIINELMVPDFLEKEGECITLTELDEMGKSELKVYLGSKENLCIKNVDSKKTDLLFLTPDREKSLYKRVDHIIYEHREKDNWKLHLVEMKTSVGINTWKDIKGKFRASYLLARSIAAILELNIIETYMYTTYERMNLSPSPTMPSERRLSLGKPQIRPEEEWDGGKFALNFGVRVAFHHEPIHMTRDGRNILTGTMPRRA